MLIAPSNLRAAEPTTTIDISSGDRTYRIWEMAIGAQPAEGYPLVVLLDGNQMFPLAAKIAADDGRPRLLVGVGYPEENRDTIVTRRYFDLTPETPDDLLPETRSGQPVQAGGQDDFSAFLTGTVLPGVTQRHRINSSDTTLFGHSLGGLMAMHMLFQQAWPFTGYTAADPSIWWKNSAILGELDAFEASPEKSPLDVTIITSGKRPHRKDVSQQANARMQSLRGGPNGKDVAARLAGFSGLTVNHIPMPDESHGSMVEPALRILLTK